MRRIKEVCYYFGMKKIIIALVLIGIAFGFYYQFALAPGSNENITVKQNDSEEALDEQGWELPTSEEFTEGEEGFVGAVEDANTSGWNVYTNDKWKYSFEYPSEYTLVENDRGFRVVVSPSGDVDDKTEFLSVVVIQHPPVEKDDIPESLFHVANFPDGEVAWLKEKRLFKYEDYFIESQDVQFGTGDREAIKVRETSIIESAGEHRSLVYVLRDSVIYRVTHDIASEGIYGEIIKKIEDSFGVLE